MKWSNFSILGIGQGIAVFFLSILTFLFFDVETALAHIPHDDVVEVEISPNYEQDQTVFHIAENGNNKIWGNLFKSENGGHSWQRIEQGLDHKHSLSSLAVSAQSSEILYLSTLGDGIYKSENQGASWIKVNQGLGTLNLNLISIAADSNEVVLAAGTETGLYKTNNGGASWYQVIDSDRKITAMAFAYDRQDNVVIGDNQGNLLFSDDRGESWQPLLRIQNSGVIKTIMFSPNFDADQTLFVGTEKGGIFKSVDRGNSFVAVNQDLADRSIVSLGISPNYGKDYTLFASTWHDGVFYSNDGGNTWSKYSRGLTKSGQADSFKQPHFKNLSISPAFSQDQTIFVAGFDGIFKSKDGGRVWQDLKIFMSGANRIKKIAISPNYQNDSTLAIATFYGGVYLSQDQGNKWTPINHGLKIAYLLKQNLLTSVMSLAFSPSYSEDNTILASATDKNGSFFKSTDRGEHWQNLQLPRHLRADPRLLVSPQFASDNTIYLITIEGQVLRSTNEGKSFSLIGKIGNRAISIPSLAISPDFASDQTMYVGGFPGGVYKTVDGGRTWQRASNGIATQKEYIKLAVSPNYKVDQTVLAGTAEGIFKTIDGGKSWNKLAGTADVGAGYIDEIAISPNYQSDQTLMVSVRGKGLFKTVDGGITFTQIGDYFSGPIKFSPAYSLDQTIYGASDTELFKSKDDGNTWKTIVVPKAKNNFVSNYLTYLYIRMSESPLRRFIAASIVALFGYLLFGYLPLENKLPFRKWKIKSASTFTVFMGVFIFLSV